MPTQEEIEAAVLRAAEEDGVYENECPSSIDIANALYFANRFHIAAFVILGYMLLHKPIFSRLASCLRTNRLCCYKLEKEKTLDLEEL